MQRRFLLRQVVSTPLIMNKLLANNCYDSETPYLYFIYLSSISDYSYLIPVERQIFSYCTLLLDYYILYWPF